jgi:hypothetical protein
MILNSVSELEKEHATLKVRDKVYNAVGVAGVAAGVTATVFVPPVGAFILAGTSLAFSLNTYSSIDPRAEANGFHFSGLSQNAKPAFLNLSHSFYQAGVA